VSDNLRAGRKAGVKGMTILNARGEGLHHESFMGITVDTEKEMILFITDKAASEKAMAAIKKKAGIRTPAHSICLTMPVEKVVGVITYEA